MTYTCKIVILNPEYTNYWKQLLKEGDVLVIPYHDPVNYLYCHHKEHPYVGYKIQEDLKNKFFHARKFPNWIVWKDE